ncbi:MAG: hypothetical protein GY722_24065, partial [bacterium]|nr:hypothetical protein [bacterium]
MNTNSQYSKALICLLILATTAEALGSGKASLTSSFFGTVSVDGNPVPE